MRIRENEIEQIPPEGKTLDPKIIFLVLGGVWLAMVIWMKSTGRRPLLWR